MFDLINFIDFCKCSLILNLSKNYGSPFLLVKEKKLMKT